MNKKRSEGGLLFYKYLHLRLSLSLSDSHSAGNNRNNEFALSPPRLCHRTIAIDILHIFQSVISTSTVKSRRRSYTSEQIQQLSTKRALRAVRCAQLRAYTCVRVATGCLRFCMCESPHATRLAHVTICPPMSHALITRIEGVHIRNTQPLKTRYVSGR